MRRGASAHGQQRGAVRRFSAWVPACLALWVLSLSSAAATEEFRYQIRQGDNPWNITSRFLKDMAYWPRIQEYNGIGDSATALQPGTTLRIPMAWMRTIPQTAIIADVHGEVLLQRQHGTPQAAAAGMLLMPGNLLRTGSGGSAVLQFPDGSRALLGAGSTLRLVELNRLTVSSGQQVRFELQQGEIESEVKPAANSGGRFVIQTPAATAAVRGTRFRVASAAGRTRNETLQGTVALQNRRGTTLLGAGRGAYVQAGAEPGTARPLMPAPVLDILPERVERLPLRVEIPAVAGARAYRSQFVATAGAGVIESDRSSPTPHVLSTDDLPDGIHRIRVRAVDENGLEGRDAEREIVIDARPEPPFPSAPAADGWMVDEHPTFRWTRSDDAVRYHFQLAAAADFATPLVNAPDLNRPEWIAAEPLTPGVYFWRVALETTAEGRGPYSDPQRFTVPPPGPQPQAPVMDGDKLELRWRAGAPGERFQVQASRDAGFAEPEIDQMTDESRLVLPRPAPGTLHLRVRTLASDTPPGPWGKAQQIEIPNENWSALLLLVPALFLAL